MKIEVKATEPIRKLFTDLECGDVFSTRPTVSEKTLFVKTERGYRDNQGRYMVNGVGLISEDIHGFGNEFHVYVPREVKIIVNP